VAFALTTVTCTTASAGGTAKGKPAFKILQAAPHGVVPAITRGLDGRMRYPESFADQIGAITNAGVASHYRAGVDKGDQPNTIVAGPDGNLWYTLYSSAGKVGRMTTKGVRTEFDTGAVVNSLVGIGPGDGSSIWVGGEFSQLWHLDANGAVLAHVVPPALTASRIPVKFIRGKDTRIWVDLGIFIAAIDSAGTVTEFTQGYTPSPNIRDMTLGPDGNIWFVDSENLNVTGVVGRITSAGVVTLFSKGLKKGSAPLGITVGSDHNLWFTENAGGPHIARITTSGVITTYKIPLPGSYTATALARGQGRSLWVTSNGVPGLVKVTLP
jgi:streptogramin lyase